jgi:hypothetical protein
MHMCNIFIFSAPMLVVMKSFIDFCCYQFLCELCLQHSIVFYEQDGDEAHQFRRQADLVRVPDHEILQVVISTYFVRITFFPTYSECFILMFWVNIALPVCLHLVVINHIKSVTDFENKVWKYYDWFMWKRKACHCHRKTFYLQYSWWELKGFPAFQLGF